MAELPSYQRTILRQVQETDMSEANVWATLAQTMDNFSSQIGSFTSNQINQKNQRESAARAAKDKQTALDLTASKYEKSQLDAKTARDLAAEKYEKSQSDAENARILAAERYAKSQEEKKASKAEAARKLAVQTFVNAKESDVITTLSQLSIDYANDYEGYLAAANELQKAWLENDDLDNTVGMRIAFETLITNKIAQYGEAPYQNVANAAIQQAKVIAEDNVETFVTDAVHEMTQFIDGVMTEEFLIESELDDMYVQQLSKVAGKYMVLEQKLTELITNNNYTADEVIAIQDEMELNFFSGVIKAQINNEMKNNNGWNAIDEFEESPTDFIKNRPHLQALIPEGVVIDDDMADVIYDEIFKHYKDTNDSIDYLEAQVDAEDAIRHSANYSSIFQMIVAGDRTVTADYLAKQLEDNQLSTTGHDAALKAITLDTYVVEDDNVIWSLNKQIVDKVSNYQDREDAISEAFMDGDISIETASAMLAKIVTADDIRQVPFFDNGYKAIERGLVGNPEMMDAGSGQVLNFALQEYYNRVEGYTDTKGVYHAPEDPQDIYNEIIEKYKPMMVDSADDSEVIEVLPYPTNIDTKIGASYQTMEFNSSTGWNTFFIGTPDAPAAVQTQIKVAQLIIDKVISEDEGAILLKQLDDYMQKHLGLE
jgi:hypothetical protein